VCLAENGAGGVEWVGVGGRSVDDDDDGTFHGRVRCKGLRVRVRMAGPMALGHIRSSVVVVFLCHWESFVLPLWKKGLPYPRVYSFRGRGA